MAGLTCVHVDPVRPLPWEFWSGPEHLPRLAIEGRGFLRSSYCPSGCRYDRHSSGDSRFLRTENGEGVLLEEAGPGAITRIWMTMGHGRSIPLDPAIRIRIYLDGEPSPRIDLPLPELFSGDHPPFVPPLVGHRLTSSGGNFSYVPIHFRAGCKVTLVGAENARIWFQINHHRLADASRVETFSGGEDHQRLLSVLEGEAADPWQEAGASHYAGEVVLAPGQSAPFHVAKRPGLVTGLWLDAPPAIWDHLRLHLTFDGKTTLDLAVRDAFAIGQGGSLPTRSLLVGLDAEGSLYSLFPMPYFRRVEMRLSNAASAPGKANIAYRVRQGSAKPHTESGYFGARVWDADLEASERSLPLVELEGRGKWVGLFSELGATGGQTRDYLEGDERVYLDGSPTPALHGTGTEDLFNGGFYFDRGPYRHSLHGMTYHLAQADHDTTAAYRLLLAEAVSFERAIRTELEAGPTGETAMRARTVSFYYLRAD